MSDLLYVGIELTESGSGMKQSLEPPSASQESDSAFSDTPSPQPEEKKSTNPFADDEVVSTNPFAPVPSRRLTRRPSLEMEDLSSDFLVKTTLTKARSMVGIPGACVNVCVCVPVVCVCSVHMWCVCMRACVCDMASIVCAHRKRCLRRTSLILNSQG